MAIYLPSYVLSMDTNDYDLLNKARELANLYEHNVHQGMASRRDDLLEELHSKGLGNPNYRPVGKYREVDPEASDPNVYERITRNIRPANPTPQDIKLPSYPTATGMHSSFTPQQRTQLEDLHQQVQMMERAGGGLSPAVAAAMVQKINTLMKSGLVPLNVMTTYASILERAKALGMREPQLLEALRNATTTGTAAMQPSIGSQMGWPERQKRLQAIQDASSRVQAFYKKTAQSLGVSVEELVSRAGELSDEQLNYVQSGSFQRDLEASPGSGKTRTVKWAVLDAVANRGARIQDFRFTAATHSAVDKLEEEFAKIAPLIRGWDFQSAKQSQFRTMHSLALQTLNTRLGSLEGRTPLEAMGRSTWELAGGANVQTANFERAIAAADAERTNYLRRLFEVNGIKPNRSFNEYAQHISRYKSNQGSSSYTQAMDRGKQLYESGQANQKSDPDAVLYLYQMNMERGGGFRGTPEQQKSRYDFDDAIHMFAKVAAFALTHLVLDERQDPTLDILRAARTVTGKPGSFLFMAGDMGQRVFSGTWRGDQAIPALFPSMERFQLSGNYRSPQMVVSHIAGFQSQLRGMGAEYGTFQVALSPDLGEQPTWNVFPTFQQTHVGAFRDWMGRIGVTPAQMRANVLGTATTPPQYPLTGHTLAPAQAPFVFQMQDERRMFLEAIKQEISTYVGAQNAQKVMDAIIYPMAQGQKFSDPATQHQMRVSMLQQIKGHEVQEPFIMVTRGGKWDEPGYQRNLLIGASRAISTYHAYGATQDFPRGSRRYGNRPDINMATQELIPMGFAGHLPLIAENLVQSQGVPYSTIPGSLQYHLDMPGTGGMPTSQIHVDPAIQEILEKVVIPIMLMAQKAHKAPAGGEGSGIMSAAGLEEEMYDDEGHLAGFQRRIDVDALAGKFGLSADSLRDAYTRRLLQLVIAGGPQALSLLSHTGQIPEHAQSLRELLRPTIGHPSKRELRDPFGLARFDDAVPTTLPQDWNMKFELLGATNEDRGLKRPRGSGEPTYESDISTLRQAIVGFLAVPQVRQHPAGRALLEEQFTNRKLMSFVEGKAIGLGYGDLFADVYLQAIADTPEIARMRKGHERLKSHELTLEDLEKMHLGMVHETRIFNTLSKVTRGTKPNDQELRDLILNKAAALVSSGDLTEDLYETLIGIAEQLAAVAQTPRQRDEFLKAAQTLHAHFGYAIDQSDEAMANRAPTQWQLDDLARRNPLQGEEVRAAFTKPDGSIRTYREVQEIEHWHTVSGQVRRGSTTDPRRLPSLGISVAESRVAPFVTELAGLYNNLQRYGLQDPMNQGRAATLDSLERRLKEQIAMGLSGRFDAEAIKRFEEVLIGVQGIKLFLGSPELRERSGHVLNMVMQVAMGKGAFLTKEDYGKEGNAFDTFFMPFKDLQWRNLGSLKSFVLALEQATMHVASTGTLSKQHIEQLLTTLGHDPTNAGMFPALDFLNKRGMWNSQGALSLSAFPQVYQSNRDTHLNLLEQFTRTPLHQGREMTFMGGSQGFGRLIGGQQGIASGMRGRLLPFKYRNKKGEWVPLPFGMPVDIQEMFSRRMFYPHESEAINEELKGKSEEERKRILSRPFGTLLRFNVGGGEQFSQVLGAEGLPTSLAQTMGRTFLVRPEQLADPVLQDYMRFLGYQNRGGGALPSPSGYGIEADMPAWKRNVLGATNLAPGEMSGMFDEESLINLNAQKARHLRSGGSASSGFSLANRLSPTQEERVLKMFSQGEDLHARMTPEQVRTMRSHSLQNFLAHPGGMNALAIQGAIADYLNIRSAEEKLGYPPLPVPAALQSHLQQIQHPALRGLIDIYTKSGSVGVRTSTPPPTLPTLSQINSLPPLPGGALDRLTMQGLFVGIRGARRSGGDASVPEEPDWVKEAFDDRAISPGTHRRLGDADAKWVRHAPGVWSTHLGGTIGGKGGYRPSWTVGDIGSQASLGMQADSVRELVNMGWKPEDFPDPEHQAIAAAHIQSNYGGNPVVAAMRQKLPPPQAQSQKGTPPSSSPSQGNTIHTQNVNINTQGATNVNTGPQSTVNVGAGIGKAGAPGTGIGGAPSSLTPGPGSRFSGYYTPPSGNTGGGDIGAVLASLLGIGAPPPKNPFGFSNIPLSFGHQMARLGSEIMDLGGMMAKNASDAATTGGEYRQAILQIPGVSTYGVPRTLPVTNPAMPAPLRGAVPALSRGGAQAWLSRGNQPTVNVPSSSAQAKAAYGVGTEGFFNFNATGGISTLQQQLLPMYSLTQIAQGIQAYTAMTGTGMSGSAIRGTTDIMGLAAMSGMDPTELMGLYGGITGYAQAGGGNRVSNAALTSQLTGMAYKTFGGNMNQSNIAPYFQAMQQAVPMLSATGGISSMQQAGGIFQLALNAGYTAQNLPDVASMIGGLSQIGMNPDVRQQATLARIYGQGALTASPQYFQSQGSLLQQQQQVATMGIRVGGLSQPQLQIRVDQATINANNVGLQAQALSLAQGQAGFAFNQYMQTQQYGPIGETSAQTGRSAYFAYMNRQMGAGYNPLNAESASTFQFKGQPFGLQNLQFYAGIENQRQMLVLGRSKLTSDAAFQQQMKYLNQQETFYNQSLQLTNQQRQFDKTWAEKQLDMQAKQLTAAQQSVAAQNSMLTYDIKVQNLQQTYLPLLTTNLQAQIAQMQQYLGGQGPIHGGNIQPSQLLQSMAASVKAGGNINTLANGLNLDPGSRNILIALVQQLASGKMSINQAMTQLGSANDQQLLAALQGQAGTGAYLGGQQQATQSDISLKMAGLGQDFSNLTLAVNNATLEQKNWAQFFAPTASMQKWLGTIAGQLQPLVSGIGALSNAFGVFKGLVMLVGGGGAGGAGGAGGVGVGGPGPGSGTVGAGTVGSAGASGPAAEYSMPPPSAGALSGSMGFWEGFLENLSAISRKKMGSTTYNHYGILSPNVNADFHQKMWYGLHSGVDFAASQGTPLYEFIGGKVKATGFFPWGGEVDVTIPGGVTERYLHLSQIGVQTGQVLKQGQRVGLTGGGTPASGLGYWSHGAHNHVQYDYGNINQGINPWVIWAAFGDHNLQNFYGSGLPWHSAPGHGPHQPGGMGGPGTLGLFHLYGGGIAMRPLRANLAETGPEAIIPLSRLKAVLSSSTPVGASSSQASGGTMATRPSVTINSLSVSIHTASATMTEAEKDQMMADTIDVVTVAINNALGKI